MYHYPLNYVSKQNVLSGMRVSVQL